MRAIVGTILRFCLLCAALAGDATSALDSARSIYQYRHTRWTAAEGAPPVIYALAQGADGYIWIGSAAGLYRFDGVVFEHIQLNDRNGAIGRVVALLAARDGTIWVGYNSGDIATFRDGVLLRDRSAPKVDAVMFGFHQTGDGSIWIIPEKFTTRLFRRRDGRWGEIAVNLAPQPSAGQALVTRDGALWVLAGKSAYIWDAVGERFVSASGGPALTPDATALSQDPTGRIWVSGGFGTRPFLGTDPKPFPTPPFKTWIVFARFDRDGNLWGLNREGLFRVRAASRFPSVRSYDAVERFRAVDGLTADTASGFLEDREGNIWIGSSLGLDQFRNADVVVEKRLTGLPYLGFGLLGAADGTVYVGTSDGLYSIAVGARPQLVSSAVRNAHQLCEAADGSIWAFSDDKVQRIKGGVVSRQAVSNLQSIETTGQGFGGCALDGGGRLWVTGVESGLYRTGANGWQHFPRAKRSWVVSLTPDQARRPLGLDKMGTIAEIDDGGRSGKILFKRQKDRAVSLGSFIAQTHSDLYLVESAELSRVRNGTLETVDAERFPWLADPRGLVDTPDGQTWMIGRAGIVGVVTADLAKLFGRGLAPAQPIIFSFEDGLPNVGRTVGQNGAVRGGDGRLWFVTIGGVVWVDPARLTRNPVPPPVQIRGIVVGKRQIRDPVNIVLAKGSSRVEIQYTAMSLSIPQRVRFRYRLEGVDEEWVDAGTRRKAFYTNLGPGHYRFRVIAANNDGVWNSKGAVLDFDVPPTFVESDLFRIAALIGGGALAWWLYVLRVGQIKSKMRARLEDRLAERERIARDLHDTLLQGFQGLILRFQAVANQIPDSLPARTLLERTLDSADEVLDAGRENVRHLRAAESTDLAIAFSEAVARLRLDHPVQFNMVVEGAVRELHPVVREELYRIGAEALINAFRHANATLIELALSYQHSALSLGVRDDGIGIQAAIIERGGRQGHFGLVGMRERAQQIGADLEVSSRAGGGTEVQITVPGDIAYQVRQSYPGWLQRISHALGLGPSMQQGN